MGESRSSLPILSAMQLHRILSLFAYGIAPAVAAGAITIDHVDSFGAGVIVGVSVFLVNQALTKNRYPLHLMPLASVIVRGLAPVIGAALGILVLDAAGHSIAAEALIAPIVGAWVVTAFAAFAKAPLESARPIRIALIGSPYIAIGLDQELKMAKSRSYKVVGWIADKSGRTTEPGDGPRRLGALDQVREVVVTHQVDLLVHSSRPAAGDGDAPFPSRLELFERVATDCLDTKVRLIEVGQLYEELLGHVPLGQSNAAWFQYLLHPRYRPGSSFSKRTFDILVGGTMLLALSPFLAAFALAVKLTDGGPVFYRQRRVGERGREFELVKLRSMRVDSEDRGAAWSSAEDDRITKVGKVMRRLHVDEMPQLFNILRGEMTLVGPRPERQEIISRLERQLVYYDRRHLVKPGLAGWAQARCGYGGSDEGTGWKLCHDLFYLKHRSMYFDALILIENVRVSLSGKVQFGVRAPQKEFIISEVG